MTQAEQFVKHKYGVPIEALKLNTEEMFHLMDNFVYESLKNLYNSLGREHSTDTILQTVANYKAKFHHT